MGLLSRLTKAVTPQRQASDDVLMVHAMMLMCGADGVFDPEEIATVEAYFSSLPEFRESGNFQEVYDKAVKILQRFESMADSVNALAELSNQNVKNKTYLIAADIAMSSGDVDENEDRMLEAMQRTMTVSDQLAEQVITVLTIKYQAC